MSMALISVISVHVQSDSGTGPKEYRDGYRGRKNAISSFLPLFRLFFLIADMLVRYTPCRVLRSSDRHLLNVPKTNKKTYGDRAFSAAAPRLWNSLPLDLKISPSVSIFKSFLIS